MTKKNLLRYVPLSLLILLMLVVYFSNLYEHLSFASLKKEQASLKLFTEAHPLISPLLFLLVYTVSVCLIIPDSTILTLIGGFAFPLPLAVFLSLLAETLGALIFFLIIKETFNRKKERHYLYKMRQNFHRNAISYLLFLRFSHILPFWFINLTAAYCSVPIRTFVWTTLVGVLPLTYLLSDAGRGLSHIFSTEATFNLRILFTTEMKITLFVFSLLALIPLIYKNWIKRKFGKGLKHFK